MREKPTEAKKIKCIDCENSRLFRRGSNPVIAECIHGRFVANYGRYKCEDAVKRTSPLFIELINEQNSDR